MTRRSTLALVSSPKSPLSPFASSESVAAIAPDESTSSITHTRSWGPKNSEDI